jgi:hypothetical protein
VPIHDQSYRRYGGQRAPLGSAWTVIAEAGLRSMLAKKAFLGLLIFAWLPFVIRAVQMYLAANFPQTAPLLGPTAQTFREFLEQQGPFVFFVTIYAGAGLIANDRRANALQIYLSKPLMRIEYIAGKLAVLVTLLLAVTWVPGIMLLVVQMVFAGSLAFVRENVFLFPAITVLAFLQTITAALTMLALSSLSKSSRYVGVLYAGAVFFTDRIFDVLRLMSGDTLLSWVSLPANLAQVGDVIFRVKPRYDTPWLISLIVIVALLAVSVSVLERRVRGVEVVV